MITAPFLPFDDEDTKVLEMEPGAMKSILGLSGVSRQYIETVRLLAQAIVANRYCRMFLTQCSQLIELGQGMFDSRQSDRHDDVVLYFIDGFCGHSIFLRLRGTEMTFEHGRTKIIIATSPLLDASNRAHLCSIIDTLMESFYHGGEIVMPDQITPNPSA